MSVNSRFKATKIIGQRKAFYRQRIPESSCVRKETVDIDIFVTSRNVDRKIVQSNQNNEQTSLENKKVEPVQPVQMNYCQGDTYRKQLSWLLFDDELKVQERQQVKKQPSCIFISLAYPTIPTTDEQQLWRTSPDMTTVFHTCQYARFIEKQSNLKRKKLHRTNQGSNFL